MVKAVVLVSGGYDSAVCLALLESLGYEGVGMHFNYGQKSSEKELARARLVTEKYGKGKFSFLVVDVRAGWVSHTMNDGYFPSRNVIFLSYALSYAESYNMDNLILGAIKAPYDYPDTSPEFSRKFRAITESVGIGLWCPLHDLDKNGVYALGNKLGVDIKDTWSCDNPTEAGEPCGICGDCRDIQKGVEAGLISL